MQTIKYAKCRVITHSCKFIMNHINGSQIMTNKHMVPLICKTEK